MTKANHPSLTVPDQQIAVDERPLSAVKGRKGLPLRGPPNDDRVSLNLAAVECVQWVTQVQHHEVGGIDRVIDGADTHAVEQQAEQ